MKHAAVTLLTLALTSAFAVAQDQPGAKAGAAPGTSKRAPAPRIYLDDQGVIRWRANQQEVTLFGANYCAFSSGDYRLAVRVGSDVRKLIEADLAHFARMGWDGLRLCTWGDWESADAEGNRIDNINMQLMDYLIAKAKERDMHMLLSPIHTYSSAFADQMGNPDYKPGGFSSVYPRKVLGIDPKAIAAQVKYIGQVLNHVNPHTGLALKDDPAILFVEMINEPVHNSKDIKQSVEYINTLVDAVRSTGSQQITFHNYSQDFAIAEALAQSKVQGIDFGWYPAGLNTGRTQPGNFLHTVDSYPDMLNPKLRNKPRIVYEFDQSDLVSGYMYPAMARTFRSVGTQFAAIFAYDMLATAPYNLSWQTHFINLVHTPRKAISGVIAGEAMRRLPRMKSYGSYPQSKQFGDFSVDYETDSSLLNADDAYMNAGDTTTAARKPTALKRVAGFGSSPVVSYEGTGAYFLDQVSEGVWRLEVYPDSIFVSEPFAQPQPGKVVSRLYFKSWPMGIALPDLGQAFTATPLNLPANQAAQARRSSAGRITVEPGVWLLSRSDNPDLGRLPAKVNRVALREYHVNAPQAYPDLVLAPEQQEFVAGGPARLTVRLASQRTPEKLDLYIRSVGGRGFGRPIPMRHKRGYEYEAELDPKLAEGHYEYIVALGSDAEATVFPGQVKGLPGRWGFDHKDVWRFTVSMATRPLELFNARRDTSLMTWVRPSEADRTPGHRLHLGETSDGAALSLTVPRLNVAQQPDHNAGTVYIGDKIGVRGAAMARARALTVRLKAGDGKRKTLDLFLIEKDGSSWQGSVLAGEQWNTATLPLASMRFARSALTPTPYPGTWNYWRQGPASRANGKMQPAQIERLELRVRTNTGERAADDAQSVEVSSVQLQFD